MEFLPNFSDFAGGAPLPFPNLLKGLTYLMGLLQRVICFPFDHFACGNRHLHATQITENFKKTVTFKIPCTIRDPYLNSSRTT
jgi:hypothetical protein